MPRKKKKKQSAAKIQRRYYWKHRKAIREKRKRERAERGYEKKRREKYGDYIKARTLLYYTCRPDIARRARLKSHYRGLDFKEESILFGKEKVEKLNTIYQEKLRQLRIAFGRNPDTGRVIKGENRGRDDVSG